MITTVGVAGPLLVLQSLPSFAAERLPGSPLPLVSLLLAVLPCAAGPLALVRRGTPALTWLRLSAVGFLALVVLERFEIPAVLPQASTPWLVSLACVAFSYTAVGVLRSGRAAVGCALAVLGAVTAYASRVPVSTLVVEGLGLAALALGLIIGVRALRRRADTADEAQSAANERFDTARRTAALEEERTRTDALLHDSVLNALLAAASTHDDKRTLVTAQNALHVLASSGDGPVEQSATRRFNQAIASVERELAPMRRLVQFDLTEAHTVELPTRVADTLISAMLQALDNSIKHAGPAVTRTARAIPTNDGGIRLTVRDDGRGFDLTAVAPERLGVRNSIVNRVRLIGGSAEIRSTPAEGTTVVLEWLPTPANSTSELFFLGHA